jgi:p-aminobenzoyl-glutamate transporter AbgT
MLSHNTCLLLCIFAVNAPKHFPCSQVVHKLQFTAIGRLIVVMGRDFISALLLVACCTVLGPDENECD